MKLIILLLFALPCKAQFIGFGAGNGGCISVGYENEFIAQYNLSYSSRSTLYHNFTAGYVVGNKWNAAILGGYTVGTGRRRENSVTLKIDRSNVERVYYGLELGFTQHVGKAFLLVDRNGFRIGIKYIHK